MKRLTLVRHAKSSRDDPNAADFERPLSERGRRDAPLMARLAAQSRPVPDLLISSPAARALATASAFARALGIPVAKIVQQPDVYLACVSELRTVVHSLGSDVSDVFLFGHNPGMLDFAEFLTGEMLGRLPTCSVVVIDFDVGAWREVGKGGGVLAHFDYPKRHR